YGVNVVLEHEPGQDCPIVIDNTPTMVSLLGIVDREWGPQGPGRSDYRMIRAGSLLQADGGYLVLEARELLREPGAWKVLVRTLRTGKLEIVPTEYQWPGMVASLKPEPIPVSIKVILLGDRGMYYLLDEHDPDFSQLFKVLVDFDTEIDREPDGPMLYARVLARIARDEKLPPFDRTGVAALAEHGARIAARRRKLSALFSRVADIAREAAFLARQDVTTPSVNSGHVEHAVDRGKKRADLPSRRFRQYLADGTIHVLTNGSVAGQINGLAVIAAGPLKYGFPARITASIGAGSAGVIDIESLAQLSGAIHTKGFNILNGLLRNLLNTDHPLAFSASVAFEQSYGGIDGDSASGAEICCLLSALTDVPIKQGLAMTGAIDQLGAIQAIGGVNEKVEGFYDICKEFGLTGDQGVIIPHSNAGDLMLRHDVVEACETGKFHIWAVHRVHEALELLTGMAAGELNEDGEYEEGTLLDLAVERAAEYWLKSSARPTFEITGEPEDDATPGEAAAAAE
ncbi:MAG: AAA family ATPase, partial [Planctomycetota bacterium]|nr:AAA family ATPase [Planctomycetota bacterium]